MMDVAAFRLPDCPDPPMPANVAAQALLNCVSAAGWPSLADLLTTAALPAPPPLPIAACNATMTYVLDADCFVYTCRRLIDLSLSLSL